MKKIVLLVLISLVYVDNAFSYCVKCDCTANIQSAKQQAIQEVQNSYNRLNQAMDKMKEKYNEYKKQLKKQNEYLKDIRDLKKETALSERKILFLLKQNNLTFDKIIDVDNEEGIKHK